MKRIAFLLCLLAFPASAQEMACGPHEAIVAKLSSKEHGERLMFVGAAEWNKKPATVQLWANRDTASWSVLVVMEDGISCLALYGNSLRVAPAPKPAEQKS